MKQAIKRIVPKTFLIQYREYKIRKRIKHAVKIYEGNDVTCSICNSDFKEFAPFGFPIRKNAQCHQCGALERHRLLWKYMNEKTDLLKSKKKIRLLQFAPEQVFFDVFSNHDNIEYFPCDLVPENYYNWRNAQVLKADITNIPFEDNYFDVIICNHILEHIPDDALAISELYRVLKKGGWSILQVPIDYSREKTYEDFSITDPEEREKAFGQSDHVRWYGQDYKERLRNSGFTVTEDDYVKSFSEQDIFKYGFMDSELIYYCQK